MGVSARRVWTLAEPLHALTYFAAEPRRAFEDAGLRGFWRGYFAGRAAPFGAATPGLVTATFFGFHPAFVARAVPSVWTMVDPSRALEARLEGIDRATHRIFDRDRGGSDWAAAAMDLRRAVDATPIAGRPLFGANAALPWPEPAHLMLWHAVTLLREHRGDGHVHALVAAGVDACEAHVLRIADESLPMESIQPYRGWNERDCSGAAERLAERGWLDGHGTTTPEGKAARAGIEDTTDALSAPLVDRIPDPSLVLAVLDSVTARITASGAIPYPNPVGVPRPDG